MSDGTLTLIHRLTDRKNEDLLIQSVGGEIVLATCCASGVILDEASAVNVARSLLEAAGRADLSGAVRDGLA